MIEVRKVIQSHLKTIHPRIFFQKAYENAQFPYVVYEIEILDLGDNLQLVTLDVDGWSDDYSDTTDLENLMSNIDASFKKEIIINDSLVISFYRDRKLSIIDDDPRINRRKYIYQARLYERL